MRRDLPGGFQLDDDPERGPYTGCRWLLHTLDAHGLYAKVSFGPPSERLLERQ